jgi:hypothetical protein
MANKRDWKLLVKRKKKASIVVAETDFPAKTKEIILTA